METEEAFLMEEDDEAHLAIPCTRLLEPVAVKPDMADGILPKWLKAVAVVMEPDVLARLFDLLCNWADTHKHGRPRIAMEIATDSKTMPSTAAATTVLMGDLAVFVPLVLALDDEGGSERARVAGLIGCIEALAQDVGVSKVVPNQREEQKALAVLSQWRRWLESQTGAGATAAPAAPAAAEPEIIVVEDSSEEEGGPTPPPRQQQQEALMQRLVRLEEQLQIDRPQPGELEIPPSFDFSAPFFDRMEVSKSSSIGSSSSSGKSGLAVGGGGGAGGEMPVAYLSMAHDVGQLFTEQVGAAAVEQGGGAKEEGQGPAPITAREDKSPSLPDILRGLARVGRLSLEDVGSLLALHAVVEVEEAAAGSPVPSLFTWGPALPEMNELWEEWEEEEQQQEQQQQQTAAAPAILPAGTLFLDRTYLLLLLGRLTHAAEAYGAILGGARTPQMQELLRPVATYRFRWGLDPGPVDEPGAVNGQRWRALCVENVGREVTQFLVWLQQARAQKSGRKTTTQEEEEEMRQSRRLLRVEWPHVFDERLLRIVQRFLAYWQQPLAVAAGVKGGKGAAGGGQGMVHLEREAVEEAVMEAHRHRRGRLLLRSEFATEFVDHWEGLLWGMGAEAGAEKGWVRGEQQESAGVAGAEESEGGFWHKTF